LSLIDYAKTERQRQAIKAWEDCGEVVAKAAGVLGVSPSTVRDHIGAVKNFAASAGYTEHWDSRYLVGAGESVIGRSVYVADPDGNKTWLKTKRTATEAEKAEAFNAFVEQLCQGVIPVKRKAKGKKVRKDDLMPSIIIGDAHVGALAFRKQTGDRDFNVDKATQEIDEAIWTLVQQNARSEKWAANFARRSVTFRPSKPFYYYEGHHSRHVMLLRGSAQGMRPSAYEWR
jgi:hypothetical protein